MKRAFAISLSLIGLMSCIATAVGPAAQAAQPAVRPSAGLMIPNAASGWICTGWGINGVPVGRVCINAESNGYDAEYNNDTTTRHYVDFNLLTDSNIRVGDQGAFWANPGTIHTYFFATGNLGCARVFVYARIEGWNIFSNDVKTTGLC